MHAVVLVRQHVTNHIDRHVNVAAVVVDANRSIKVGHRHDHQVGLDLILGKVQVRGGHLPHGVVGQHADERRHVVGFGVDAGDIEHHTNDIGTIGHDVGDGRGL